VTRAAVLALFVSFVAPLTMGCLSFHKGPMPGEPKTARFADVDGVRVRYVDSAVDAATQQEGAEESAAPQQDARPTVVLVHGFASALEAWATVSPALTATHRVIALDLKGFGWTDRPEGDYSPEAQAHLLLELLRQRGVTKTAIVAHSWGSSIALATALAAPERITKIALYDAWVYEDQLPPFFHWARASGVGEALFGLWYKERADERIALAFFDKTVVDERFVDEVNAALERPGTTAAALAAVRGQRFYEIENRYRTIDKPTLLLWGREDQVTPLRFGERLARDLPNAKMVTYARCGHFPMIEARAASNRDLVAFLTKDGER
jgi:pimeloyl-ACP methyl ester carboxylesterase